MIDQTIPSGDAEDTIRVRVFRDTFGRIQIRLSLDTENDAAWTCLSVDALDQLSGALATARTDICDESMNAAGER